MQQHSSMHRQGWVGMGWLGLAWVGLGWLDDSDKYLPDRVPSESYSILPGEFFHFVPQARQPFPEMEGVYVVSPTADAVDAIKRDFKSPSEALYCSVHLFFLERVPADLLQSIKQCRTLVSRIKSFKVSCCTPLFGTQGYRTRCVPQKHQSDTKKG